MSARFRRVLRSAMLGVFAVFSTTPVPTTVNDPSAMSNADWLAAWNRVLDRHVDDAGRIDFRALLSDHGDLDRVIAFIATVDPVTAPDRFPTREWRLTYYINGYNALAMYGVLAAGIPRDLAGLRKLGFFYRRTFTVGGRQISLYDLENDVIRPLGEERIHFALNCMVVSCPRLPHTAFASDTLDRQLTEAAREFIAAPRNLRVDRDKRILWMSAIFDFYTKDFLAKAPNLIAYANRYRLDKIPEDLTVRFFDYDWTVNDRNRTGG
jgi:hypothetical protein